MLVLSRKVGERVVIDGSIMVEVLKIRGNQVRIGIQASSGVTILRQELTLGKENAVTLPGVESPPGQSAAG